MALYQPFRRFQRFVLGFFCAAYLLRGLQVITDATVTQDGWGTLNDRMSPSFIASGWFLSSILMGISAHKNRTARGFAFAVAMPVETCLSYLWGVLHWLSPYHLGGRFESLAWFGWWFVITCLVYVIGSWPLMDAKIENAKESHGRRGR